MRVVSALQRFWEDLMVRTGAAPPRTPTPAPAEAMVSLIQTTIATALGPLVSELAAVRQTIERQSEQLVSQAETIGELRAENAALKAAQAALDVSGSTPTLSSQPGALERTRTPDDVAEASWDTHPEPLDLRTRADLLWVGSRWQRARRVVGVILLVLLIVAAAAVTVWGIMESGLDWTTRPDPPTR